MKKKIIATLFTAIIATSAFLMGHATTTATEKTTITVEDVTDWNTDGKELSLSMSDGTEVYAYRSSDEYGEKRAYIPCKDVANWKVTETGLYITTADGNGFYFEK